MAPNGELDIKVSLSINELREAINEMEKSMATLSANTEAQEEFSLSGLDYDELLETYGDDPVLMTILNRMREFFRKPDPNYYKISGWPSSAAGSGGYAELDLSGTSISKWGTDTTIDTTSTVSETFTVKYDTSTDGPVLYKDTTSKYSVTAE